MDLLIYILALTIVGALNINGKIASEETHRYSSEIAYTTEEQVSDEYINYDIPIGNNLELKKGKDAYRLIVHQLGLG